MAHYAWSRIRTEKKVVERGEQVTKSGLGVSDEQWAQMLAGGSIRSKPFPAPKGYSGSAVDFIREQLREAESMSAIDEEEAVSELKKVEEVGSSTSSESESESDKKD